MNLKVWFVDYFTFFFSVLTFIKVFFVVVAVAIFSVDLGLLFTGFTESVKATQQYKIFIITTFLFYLVVHKTDHDANDRCERFLERKILCAYMYILGECYREFV